MSSSSQSRIWSLPLAFVMFNVYILFANCALAQILPDSTLPNNSSFNLENGTFNIDGGTSADSNLFHSFEQFSVPTGSTAYFRNDLNIQNIITRVTGSSISNIDGLLRANGTANLFLINPHGLIFGPNAQLNIGGSFLASTASSVIFADGRQFSAIAPQATPLLSINVPIGLQFGQTQGRILVQGSSQPLGVSPGSLAPFQNEAEAIRFFEDPTAARLTALTLFSSLLNRPSGLQVIPGRTVALVGGDVDFSGGHITALGGSIEIGSVAEPALVSLKPTLTGWSLGYENVRNFNDVQLLNQASLNTTGLGNGNIQIVGRQVTLANESSIFGGTLGNQAGREIAIRASQLDIGSNSVVLTGTTTFGRGGNVLIETQNLTVADGAGIVTGTLGQEAGGNITIRATDSLNVSNNALLTTSSLGFGSAGSISVETGNLNIQNGAKILAATAGSGNAGTLSVRAIDTVNVANNSFISASTASVGNGGALDITAKRLLIQNGAVVSTATSGQGNGGILSVNASDSVQVLGRAPDNQSPSNLDVLATSTGSAGELRINTRKLIVQSGGQVSAATFGQGRGGTLNVVASDSVELTGSGGLEFLQGISQRTFNLLNTQTGLFTASFGSGDAGDLKISTQNLVVRDGAEVLTSTFAAGTGGNLTINASNSVEVNSSLLFSGTQGFRDSGDLTINTGQLLVTNGAQVAVSSQGQASAGNLELVTGSIQLNNQGRLTAESAFGNGGNINLRSQNFLLLRGNSQISTTAGSTQANGNGGNINITTPFLVAFPDENSDITANAFNGAGGTVTINATGIFGLVQRGRENLLSVLGTNNAAELDPGQLSTNDITAISQTNATLNGQVTINTPDVDPSRGLLGLPTEVVSTSELVESSCGAAQTNQASEFIITGRGGLPPSPSEPLGSEQVWSDTRFREIATQPLKPLTTTTSAEKSSYEILPATAWRFNNQGEVTLISSGSGVTAVSTHTTCHKR